MALQQTNWWFSDAGIDTFALTTVIRVQGTEVLRTDLPGTYKRASLAAGWRWFHARVYSERDKCTTKH